MPQTKPDSASLRYEWTVAAADSAHAAHFRSLAAPRREWLARGRIRAPRRQFPPPALEGDTAWTALLAPQLRGYGLPLGRDYVKSRGIVGDPIPYSLRKDDFAASALMLCFFLTLWVMAASWRFLRGQIRDFFRTRTRGNLFAHPANSILRGRSLLVFQNCLLLGLLYFDYVQDRHGALFATLSPYLLLGACILLLWAYYGLKLLLYAWVNVTFFAPVQRRQFRDSFFTALLLQSSGVLPLVLLVVFFGLQQEAAFLAFAAHIALVKLLLAAKSWRIFFRDAWGAVHLLLYCCGLELLPALLLLYALWQSVRWLAQLG